MTIPTSRENSTRALSTADLAAASRQSPRVNPDSDEIQEAELEQSTREGAAGELERDEVMASRKGGANAVLHRRGTAPAAGSLGADEVSRDDDIGSSDERRGGGPADGPQEELLEPLFAAEQAEEYRNRWIAIQSGFVDDPSGAVRAGDELVAQVMSELANSFAGQRSHIESRLGNSPMGNTEDLRMALKSYRSFFERLLSL